MKGIESIQKIVPIQHVVRTNDPRHNRSSSNPTTIYTDIKSFEHMMEETMSGKSSVQESPNTPVLSNYDKNAREVFYYMHRKTDFKC